MGIKYYYSAPQQIRCDLFLANAEGKPIAPIPTKSKLIKTLPRVVICSVLDGNKLSFGFATCSDKDTYSRKRGREIAYSRAIGKPYTVFELPDLKDIREVSARIVDEIFDLESKRIYG